MAEKLKTIAYIKLQQVAEEINLDDANWDIVDNEFSDKKKLFDYQVEALNNALKILWKYFEDLDQNKKEFAKIYEDLDIYKDLNIKLKNNKQADLLKEFFNSEDEGEYIPFYQIANRMAFWMATGSGKTLVIVKLIALLNKLMKLGLIPKKEILFLTYREDLLQAFKEHIEEYNHNKTLENQIKLVNLKDYEKEKSQYDFSNRVFVYRSDLISDERKENILNFRDYLELEDEKPVGNWYLILDEAHKGGEDSKRQNIFSILSQKGFLFNFSATFTEAIDIVSTVYNLNLNEFINKGYGKQIYVSQEEVKAFKEKTDLNEEQKRKIILKTLINLVAVKKAYEKIKEKNLYHNPLLIFLMNSVNTKDADLKLIFQELAKIGKNIDETLFNQAKEELIQELTNAKYTIGEESHSLAFIKKFLENISKEDIYKYVYNSNVAGNIEYVINPDRNKEIALKLDSSDKPFALIKIGDISKWIKENLSSYYKENETFKDKGYFETLNDTDSPINILLGSRAFYEGWDSNRPNIITFINIGTGADSKKFVLQSIGRGIRIQPIENKRKRLGNLILSDKSLTKIWNEYKDEAKTLESLFVYATNKKTIETILEELEFVKNSEIFSEISLYKNERIENENLLLLIPKYKKEEKTLLQQENPIKFRMSKENLELLKLYFQFMPIEKFILEYETDVKTYKDLKTLIDNDKKFIICDENKNYKDIKQLIKNLIRHINTETETQDDFIPVNDEIVHFTKIKVREDKKVDVKETVKQLWKAKEISEIEKAEKAAELVKNEGISLKEAYEKISKMFSLEVEIEDVKFKKLLQHYYIPIIYTKNKKDWIKHIIDVESEFNFIEELTKIIDELDKHYDYWMFSKLDEHLDKKIYIPYLSQGKLKKFIPDFIFWFKKDNIYKILFIDPKGSKYTSYLEKVDGYKSIFEEDGKPKIFEIKDKNIKVSVDLKLYTEDKSLIEGNEYKNYWIDKNSLKDYLQSM